MRYGYCLGSLGYMEGLIVKLQNHQPRYASTSASAAWPAVDDTKVGSIVEKIGDDSDPCGQFGYSHNFSLSFDESLVSRLQQRAEKSVK